MASPRLVILETPYAGRWWWNRWANRKYARACMRDCIKRDEAPFASHLLYTQPGILDDGIATERMTGIKAGLAWGMKAEATVVYVDRGTSGGMALGITDARAAKRPVEYRSLYKSEPIHNRWHESWGDPRKS